MEKILLHNKTYDFVSNFKDDTALRCSFNELSKETFSFDFEDYYQSGYWNERYVPYALFDKGKVVANVSVNVLDFCAFENTKRYIQIGTVMTAKAYRNRGLCRFLLETVIREWESASDMIYLFANDTVLNFYPKFGFAKKTEYQYAKEWKHHPHRVSVHHLNMDEPKNKDLLFQLSDNTRCFSNLAAMRNTGLVMFYATSFMKDKFYYLEEYEAAVFADYKGNTLYLNDIFCSQKIAIEEVISAMAIPNIDKVVLGFTPVDKAGYSCKEYWEDDTTLFVRAKDPSIFDEHKLMLPILSHA